MPDNYLILPSADITAGRVTTLANATLADDTALIEAGLTNSTAYSVARLSDFVEATPVAAGGGGGSERVPFQASGLAYADNNFTGSPDPSQVIILFWGQRNNGASKRFLSTTFFNLSQSAGGVFGPISYDDAGDVRQTTANINSPNISFEVPFFYAFEGVAGGLARGFASNAGGGFLPGANTASIPAGSTFPVYGEPIRFLANQSDASTPWVGPLERIAMYDMTGATMPDLTALAGAGTLYDVDGTLPADVAAVDAAIGGTLIADFSGTSLANINSGVNPAGTGAHTVTGAFVAPA